MPIGRLRIGALGRVSLHGLSGGEFVRADVPKIEETADQAGCWDCHLPDRQPYFFVAQL